MTTVATISPGKRSQVLDLIDSGMGRNETARQTGISQGQVSRIAKDAGRTFDRTRTIAATEARQADLASRRARLAGELLDDVDLLRPRLHTTEDGHVVRSIATAIGIFTSRSLDLSAFDHTDNGTDADVDRWIAHIIGEEPTS